MFAHSCMCVFEQSSHKSSKQWPIFSRSPLPLDIKYKQGLQVLEIVKSACPGTCIKTGQSYKACVHVSVCAPQRRQILSTANTKCTLMKAKKYGQKLSNVCKTNWPSLLQELIIVAFRVWMMFNMKDKLQSCSKLYDFFSCEVLSCICVQVCM